MNIEPKLTAAMPTGGPGRHHGICQKVASTTYWQPTRQRPQSKRIRKNHKLPVDLKIAVCDYLCQHQPTKRELWSVLTKSSLRI